MPYAKSSFYATDLNINSPVSPTAGVGNRPSVVVSCSASPLSTANVQALDTEYTASAPSSQPSSSVVEGKKSLVKAVSKQIE